MNAVYKRGQESSPAGAIPTAGARSQGQVTSAGNFGETHKLVMDQLTSRGVSPQVAAGAVGSMMGESGKGLNPASYVPHDVNGPSGGLANWHDTEDGSVQRLTGLYNFAGTNDITKISPQTQAAYLGHELDTTYKSTLQNLQKATTLEQGNSIWTKQYEAPANADQQATNRLPNGQNFYNWWSQQQAQQAPAPSPTPVAAVTPQGNPQGGQSMNNWISGQQNPATATTTGVDAQSNPVPQAIPAPNPTPAPSTSASATPAPNQTAAQLAAAQPAPPAPEGDNGGIQLADLGTLFDSYASGGLVRSRPNRVASAQPGVAIPTDVGTPPGGNTTANVATSPGYADGGAVSGDSSGDDSEDGSGGFTDADGNPIEQGDGGADETSPMALLSGLGDTIGGGLKYLQSKFSLGQSSSGIPSDPSFLGNVQRLLGGEGAASKEDYAAVAATAGTPRSVAHIVLHEEAEGAATGLC